jgi:hypothetical protein
MKNTETRANILKKRLPTQTDLWRMRADNPEVRHHLVLSIPPYILIKINKTKQNGPTGPYII